MRALLLVPALPLAILASCAAGAARAGAPPAQAAGASEPWSAPPIARAVSVRDGKSGDPLTFDELLDRLARADVVFLGETHLDETTHRFELAVYEGLLARRESHVVLAMEMFERDVQPQLDAYLAGEIDEAAFLAATRPWPNYRSAYRPLIERARAGHLPVVASNFPAPLRRRVAMEGAGVLDSLPPDHRSFAPAKLLPETDEYWRRVDNAIRGHGAMMPGPETPEERLSSTQSLWDNTMGESCAKALAAHPGSLVLHVNGGFHSLYWDGTVHQLRQRAPHARILTVGITPATDPSLAGVGGAPADDFEVFAAERASDVSEGSYGVQVSRKLPYRLSVPDAASDAHPVPLLLVLPDDGLSAEEGLALWRDRLGDEAAIAVLEKPYEQTAEDLAPGGVWYLPDTFAEDVGLAQGALERAWAFVLRHQPVDPTRVAVVGEGTGATVAAASAVWAERMGARVLALEPRRYASLKDLPLPLPELRGGDPAPDTSLRVHLAAGEDGDDWWNGELGEYAGVGMDAALVVDPSDPWRVERIREEAVRAALGLAQVPDLPADAPLRHVVVASPRARLWARRVAWRAGERDGERVAVLDAPPPADSGSTPLELAPDPGAFGAERELPLCPGPFGGTTVVVVPDDAPDGALAAWQALEADDPIAAKSRFHRLRIATLAGERSLATVLGELESQHRANVLVVPAAFCADGDAMRALRAATRPFEDRMTLHFLPGLGGAR